MSGEDLPITDVRGGGGGTKAKLQDLEELAGVFDRSGDTFREAVPDVARVMVNGDLLASAILSPLTFARVEEEVATATAELGVRGLGAETDAFLIRVTADAYRLSDQMATEIFDKVDYLIGFGLGASLPFLAVGGTMGVLALAASNPALAAFLATHPEARAALAKGGSEALQGFLEDHPELVEHMVNGGGGLMDGLLFDARMAPGGSGLLDALGIDPVHGSTSEAAKELARLFTDGEPEVGAPSVDKLAPGPPESIEDLMSDMKYTNAKPEAGTIDVKTVTSTGPDGEPVTRYIVDIPGTKSWALPGQQDGTAPDLGSNLRLMGGQDTVYARGIEQAMDAAGVPKGAHVMLVGHSQGGMTASALAQDAGFDYNVDYVVTAGAPIAGADYGGGTTALSLENQGDLVPRLDGASNPDNPNHTTVTFDGRTGSIGGNHDMGQYVGGGAAVDRSSDPGLTQLRNQMGEDGYLGAAKSETRQIAIHRQQ
ncbi:MAG: hypothetical protein ABIN79_00105 [Marmoricola sp.]